PAIGPRSHGTRHRGHEPLGVSQTKPRDESAGLLAAGAARARTTAGRAQECPSATGAELGAAAARTRAPDPGGSRARTGWRDQGQRRRPGLRPAHGRSAHAGFGTQSAGASASASPGPGRSGYAIGARPAGLLGRDLSHARSVVVRLALRATQV